MTLILSAGFAVCLAGVSLAAARSGRVVLANLALLAGATWNVLSLLGQLQGGGGMAQPIGAGLATLFGWAIARMVPVPEDDRRWPFITLFSTTVFVASFMVPYVVEPQGMRGMPMPAVAGLRGAVASAPRWLAIIAVPGIMAWWARRWHDAGTAARLGEALRILALQAVAMGALFSLALAPVEFALMSPFLGFLAAVPIYGLWRFDLSPQPSILRPLFTEALLLIPAAAAAVQQVYLFGAVPNLPVPSVLLMLLPIGTTFLLSCRVARRVTALWYALWLRRLDRDEAARLDRARLSRALLRTGRMPMAPEQWWRLSEILKNAYDDRLRLRVARAVQDLDTHGRGHG